MWRHRHLRRRFAKVSSQAVSAASYGVPLHWPRMTNWGDSFGPLVTEFLSEKPVFFTEISKRHYVVIGSFLGHTNNENSNVWGAGIIRKAAIPNPRTVYYAVRGPYTRKNILKGGGECPEIYGDAGISVKDVYPMHQVPKRRRLGVVLHWRDFGLIQTVQDPAVKVINTATHDLYGFCHEINKCEIIATSSLHALIAAHAYGIPAVWIKISNNPIGDDVKFFDYLHSNGCEAAPAMMTQITSADLAKAARAAFIAIHHPENFIRACPFISDKKKTLC